MGDESTILVTKRFSVGTYCGHIVGNQRNGMGTLEYFTGHKYEGEWKDNLFHGKGCFEWPDGRRYEGQWNSDVMEGRGTYIWPDGTKYVGNFSAGKKDGPGLQTWASGNTYEGEWHRGTMHGQGRFVWSDGMTYEGSWSSNSMERGKGVFSWPNGSKQCEYTPIYGLLQPLPPRRNSDIPVFEKEILGQADLHDVENVVEETLASDGRVTAKCNFFQTSAYMHFRMAILFNKDAIEKSISYHGMTLELQAWKGGPTFPEKRVSVLRVKLHDRKDKQPQIANQDQLDMQQQTINQDQQQQEMENND